MLKSHSDRLVFMIVLAGLLTSVCPLLAQHSGDLVVARNAAGQLVIEFDFNEALPLPPVAGLLNGWAEVEPGFDHLVSDESIHDLYVLEPGAQIWLVVDAVDPALRLIDAGANIMDGPNDQTRLGDHQLHTHVTWHIDSDDPAFDEHQTEWSVTVRLEDRGVTLYADSPPYTLRFTNAECLPGDANADQVVDAADIPEFIESLLAPDEARHGARFCAVNANGDETVDGRDIQAFINLLLLG